MPEFHAEPYIYLPEINHRSVLVAWGAFYFRVRSDGQMKLVDDDYLDHIHPPREDTVGARSATYGPARVEVFDATGTLVADAQTQTTNHCWVTGLQPDTDVHLPSHCKERPVGRRGAVGLVARGEGAHPWRHLHEPVSNQSRSSVAASSLEFAIIGDFGVGVKKPSPDRQQQFVANALRTAIDTRDIRFILTTGDNIYAGRKFLGLPVGEQGDEDDDWFFTYFQPYRYILNRVCVYPSIGNHDTGESEDKDDRAQVEDNLYIRDRIAAAEAAGRASFGPGMFYRFRYGSDIELVCIDTSKEDLFAGRLFDHPNHQAFIDSAFQAANGRPAWRIPFGHHPPFSAGPRHHNTTAMHRLIPLFQRARVRAVFSGHEHNFQHAVSDGIHYFVTGAAGKRRDDKPDQFAQAHTRSWSTECHFLLVSINAGRMEVRAIGPLADDQRPLVDIARRGPSDDVVTEPMIVILA